MSQSSLPPEPAPAEGSFHKRESTVAAGGEVDPTLQGGAASPRRYSTRKSSLGNGAPAADPPLEEGPAQLSTASVGGAAAAAFGDGGGGEELLNEVNLLQPPLPSSALTMSVREYLEKEIVPSLLPALAALCEERPPAPVQYLAHYLLEKSYQNNPKP
ncbi:uncharacterized protein EMH_0009950 [Eimeria mitis]|uniref:Dpy-30 motif domain-containing protein n=1 Tax=Eimeria mitis TaxID=44415 RepID=U6K3Y1_9EIME|nr:uncharacterized protein EMH_0009950 [Eimeria mitis]CDJ31696.1 hypothetical protein, conserved [Eimeria mitis]